MRIESLQLTPVQNSTASQLSGNKKSEETKSFGQYFQDALQNVNQLQKDGLKANMSLAAGTAEDISQVIIATEKASIAMQLTMQVRNKAVEAYQEIMRMQV